MFVLRDSETEITDPQFSRVKSLRIPSKMWAPGKVLMCTVHQAGPCFIHIACMCTCGTHVCAHAHGLGNPATTPFHRQGKREPERNLLLMSTPAAAELKGQD